MTKTKNQVVAIAFTGLMVLSVLAIATPTVQAASGDGEIWVNNSTGIGNPQDADLTQSYDIGPEGAVYLVSQDRDKVVKFDVDGNVVWEWNSSGTSLSALVVRNGSVFVHRETKDNTLVALDAETGLVRYKFDSPNTNENTTAKTGRPTVDKDGNVYYGTRDWSYSHDASEVIKLNWKGEQVWKTTLPGANSTDTQPMTLHPGTFNQDNSVLYVPTLKDFFAIDTSTGDIIWNSSAITKTYEASPKTGIVVDNRTGDLFYANGSSPYYLARMDNATGDLVWSNSSVRIDKDTHLLVGKDNVYLKKQGTGIAAYNKADGSLAWKNTNYYDAEPIRVVNGGGVVIIGGFGNSNDLRLVKFDQNGNELMNKTVGVSAGSLYNGDDFEAVASPAVYGDGSLFVPWADGDIGRYDYDVGDPTAQSGTNMYQLSSAPSAGGYPDKGLWYNPETLITNDYSTGINMILGTSRGVSEEDRNVSNTVSLEVRDSSTADFVGAGFTIHQLQPNVTNGTLIEYSVSPDGSSEVFVSTIVHTNVSDVGYFKVYLGGTITNVTAIPPDESFVDPIVTIPNGDYSVVKVEAVSTTQMSGTCEGTTFTVNEDGQITSIGDNQVFASCLESDSQISGFTVSSSYQTTTYDINSPDYNVINKTFLNNTYLNATNQTELNISEIKNVTAYKWKIGDANITRPDNGTNAVWVNKTKLVSNNSHVMLKYRNGSEKVIPYPVKGEVRNVTVGGRTVEIRNGTVFVPGESFVPGKPGDNKVKLPDVVGVGNWTGGADVMYKGVSTKFLPFGFVDKYLDPVNNSDVVSGVTVDPLSTEVVVNWTMMDRASADDYGSTVAKFKMNKSSGTVTVTIDDLDPNREYIIYEDGSQWKKVVSDSSGTLEFKKNSQWSKHSYTIIAGEKQLDSGSTNNPKIGGGEKSNLLGTPSPPTAILVLMAAVALLVSGTIYVSRKRKRKKANAEPAETKWIR